MKKKIYVRGPVLSQSGYGEQARFALRALKSKEDIFDIYIEPVNWGKTGWIWEENDFRKWIDEKIANTARLVTNKALMPDISLQIGIPNEWEKIAPINMGYTAGIETTHVSPSWLVKGNEMDNILVVSEHAKSTFVGTTATRSDGGPDVKLETNIDVVHERTEIENVKLKPIENFKPSTDFNFLFVGQIGPRKNVHKTIRWWLEEFIDQEVGLVLKLSSFNNSLADSKKTFNDIKQMINLPEYAERKCKIYLLHGDLSDQQMSWLYQHESIKALINISHGEGFGLPIYEAAVFGLPIISIPWSGQRDILVHSEDESLFTEVKFELKPIDPNVEWPGVIEKGTSWAYADQGSYKMGLRHVYKNWKKVKKDAIKLQKLVKDKFDKEKLYEQFCNSIYQPSAEYLEWMNMLNEANDS